MLGLGDTAEDGQTQIPIKPHEVQDAEAQSGQRARSKGRMKEDKVGEVSRY